MKNSTKVFVSIILLIGLCTYMVSAQSSLNLVNLTINDSIQLRGLNIDNVTNILGRPTVVVEQPEFLASTLGPEICYHDLGLKFSFHPQSRDSTGSLLNVVVYLSRTWDKDNTKHYQPFNGKLSPALSGNLKSKDIGNLYENYEVVAKLVTGTKFEVIQVDGSDFYIRHMCEPLTKYLEFISIVLRAPN